VQYRPAEKDPALIRELGLQGKFVVAYIGTHGMAHHLETVLEAAERLRGEPDVCFLLVGDGAERQKLMALKDEKGLDNLIMLPQQEKERMPALWAAMDVSLVLLKDVELFRTVIPSKIFEAMAMERPIVMGVRGESLEIVEQADAGVGITPESADELAEVVLRLKADDKGRTAMGRNGRAHVTRHFDRRVLARRYEQLLIQGAPPL